MTEGLATYASGKYFDAWKNVPSIDAYVRSQFAEGHFYPLPEIVDLPGVYPWQTGVGEECVARRDQEYSEWASFIGFLVDRYGWEKVHALFESAHSQDTGSQTIQYPTDYVGILGKPLNQLQVDWLQKSLRPGAALKLFSHSAVFFA